MTRWLPKTVFASFVVHLLFQEYHMSDRFILQNAELLLGSDDGFAIWLNGEQVGAGLEIGRAVLVDSDRFPVRLRKGPNLLLVKVTQIGGEWGFCVRFRGLRAPIWATRIGE